MGGIALLTLFGFGAMYALFDLFDNDGSGERSDDEDVVTDEEEEGRFFYVDEPDTIVGTDGDDTVEASDLDDSNIDLGQGDDLIYEIDTYHNNVDIDTGDGNDSISLTLVDSELNAGSGDDQIILDNSISTIVNAGDGNDTIEGGGDGWHAIKLDAGDGNDLIDVKTAAADIWGDEYDAGDGDDTIRVTHHTISDLGTVLLSGGAGTDTFDIRIEPGNILGPNSDEGIVLTITDFALGEETLQIDPLPADARSYGSSAFQFQNATLVGSAAGTEIVLNYLEGGGPDTYSASVFLVGVFGFTEADFTIVSS